MNVEDSLGCMVRVARNACQISEYMSGLGFGDDPYFSLMADAADAVYYLVGEHTERFDQSVTYQIVHDKSMPDDACVRLLMKIYERNRSNDEQ